MIKKMKIINSSLLLLGLLLVVGSSVFIVRNAAAGDCFTDVANNSYWYGVTCWMKNKTISTGYADGTYRPDANVTRGEMALFIQRAFSNTILESYFTTGPTDWEANNDSPSAFVEPYWGWSHLHNDLLGTAVFQLSPTIPTSLYNTEMKAKGVKVCFDADPAAYITAISIKHLWYTASGYTVINSIVDATVRANVGCAVVNFSSPSGMWGADQVTILLNVTYTNTTIPLLIGTTTVVVQPSTSLAELGVDEVEPAMLGRGGITPVEYDPASGILP